MKKLIYSAAVLALAFFAGSCQRENLEPVAANGTVTYTVQVPGAIATKAADGVNNVDKLVYEVYRTAGEKVTAFSDADNCLYHREAEVKNGKAEIALELVNDQNFTVLFWAYDSSTNVYDVDDLTNVTVAPTAAANTHETAAFTGVDFVVNCVSEQGGNVKLTRPVAQLNIATTPESLKMDDTDITVSESYVKVYGLSTSFNVAKQEAGVATGDMTYTQAAVLGGTVKVGSKEYPNLAMNYLGFIPTEGANVKVDYLLKTSEGDIDNTIENVPVKPNYRTNIVGNLISGTQDYNVTLDAEWDGVAEEVEIWDGKFLSQPAFDDATSTWSVKKASELAWLAAAVNGEVAVTRAATKETFKNETFVLTADIDLGNYPWTPIGLTGDEGGFQGTFDGQGHTISNLYVDLTAEPKYQSAGLFGSARVGEIKNFTVKNAVVKNITTGNSSGASSCGTAVVVGSAQSNLTITNVTVMNSSVEGNRYCGVISGFFKGTINGCKVETVSLTATPDDLDGNGIYDNGDKVGCIVGYTNTEATITGCSAKNFSIKAYRDMGGLVGGGYTVGNYTNNVVENGTIVVDQSVTPYFEAPKTPNANPVVGRVLSGTLPDSNTSSDVAIVNTDDATENSNSFAEALANVADGGVVAVSGEISTTSLNAAGKNITIVGTSDNAIINAAAQSNYATTRGNITFKNMKFKFSSANNHNNCGFEAGNGTLVFDNCEFEGIATMQVGTFVFNNCKFTNTTEGKYAAWVYAGNVTYNNCRFAAVDRAAKVYTDDYEAHVVYNNCTFVSTNPNKTAVEIDCTQKKSGTPYYVEINNPTIENMGVAEHYAIGEGVCNLETSGQGLGIVNLNGKGYSVAHKASQISALADAGRSVTVEVAADITENVSFTQKKDLDIVLDGKGKEMNGTINITARAGKDAAGSLVIKDFNFKTTQTAKNFISSVETNYYPNNVTVSGCTFEGPSADSNVVPVTLKSSSNFVMENCTASGVHSLLQNTSGWNLTVRNCEVTNAGRGISLSSCQGVLVENVKIQASDEKYGIRADGAYTSTTTIKNCEISAFCPVVVRKASAVYNLVFDGTNTMTAANTDGLWCVIGTDEYEANGVMPGDATGAVTVTLNDAGLAASGVYGASAIQ